MTPEITMKIPFRIPASRPKASARVTNPACFGLSARWGGRRCAAPPAPARRRGGARPGEAGGPGPRSGRRPGRLPPPGPRAPRRSARRASGPRRSPAAGSRGCRTARCPAPGPGPARRPAVPIARASASSNCGPSRIRTSARSTAGLSAALHHRLLDRRLGGAIEAGRGRRPGALHARRFRSGAPEAVCEGRARSRLETLRAGQIARRARPPSRAPRWPPRPAADSEPVDRRRPSFRRGPRESRSRPGCPGSRRARRPAARPD